MPLTCPRGMPWHGQGCQVQLQEDFCLPLCGRLHLLQWRQGIPHRRGTEAAQPVTDGKSVIT